MKKILLFITLILTAMPVYAVDCGIIAEFTTPAAHIIMIIAPILLIVLGAVDIAKAVTSGDDKGMQKAFNTLLKRGLICIIILLLPLIVNMIIGWTSFNNLSACLK